jgi:hypothetical protein
MRRSGGPEQEALAHRLADAVIMVQTGSGGLAITVRNLARLPLPSEPPSFAWVCEIVERIEGVRFVELFAALPKRAPDGDAAIAEIWEAVKSAREQLSEQPA